MIDTVIQSKLRKQFNPEGSKLRQQQLRMLDMLDYIDNVCKEFNIKYWLGGGTCLGAVRHEGFIPWDDDLDIELERKDFKKLCKILKKLDGKYKLQDHSTDFNYCAPYVKLRDLNSQIKEVTSNDLNYKYKGIYIDIFCMAPSFSLKLHKIAKRIQWGYIYPLAKIKNKRKRNFLIFTYSSLTRQIIYPIISLIGFLTPSRLRHIPGTEFSYLLNKSDVKDVVYANFEGKKYPIPSNYDNYLKVKYGDYNKIPDLDSLHLHLNEIDMY